VPKALSQKSGIEEMWGGKKGGQEKVLKFFSTLEGRWGVQKGNTKLGRKKTKDTGISVFNQNKI